MSLVSISGSWCPNCHDEAPFLGELTRNTSAQGLEIVSLSFEEAEQLKNPVRLRAFIKSYGIDYTVLVPGEPKELADKLPQGVNLNSFPTTFFLGRDGRVRSVHAGFPGAGERGVPQAGEGRNHRDRRAAARAKASRTRHRQSRVDGPHESRIDDDVDSMIRRRTSAPCI